MTLWVVLVTFILIGMAVITLINVVAFTALGQTPVVAHWPKVSVLIPARNEAEVIQTTLTYLLAQNYPDFEIIVLDDNSTDDTVHLARQNPDPRLRVVTGQPLPANWLGKPWACQQLGQFAQGDWLIFTDADVQWSPQAVQAVMAEAIRTEADLLTVWPTQRTESWAERLTVPLMALVVLAYLPWPLVHYTSSPLFAAANGQCLAFRKTAYQRIGGHAAVAGEVLEDVTLARLIKQHGLTLRMVDGAGLITCRMYQDWVSVRNGYGKNILAGYGGRVSLLLLATWFHWAVFLAPWVWLVVKPAEGVILVSLGLIIRIVTARLTRQRGVDGLLMPVSVLLMTRIAAQAILWQWQYGGPLWKGRVIKSEL